MRQHSDQKTSTSSRVRNSSGLYIDSQGNSIPLSPVSSSSSGSSDNVVEHHKPSPMTPSGKIDSKLIYCCCGGGGTGSLSRVKESERIWCLRLMLKVMNNERHISSTHTRELFPSPFLSLFRLITLRCR
jgi:hypothetical protein